MPTEFVRRNIDQIVENALTDWLTFHRMGEPFLHRGLCCLTEDTESRGLKV